MGFFDNTARIRQLMADRDRHVGDIAILKCDSIGLDARPELRDRLAPVRGWLPSIDITRLREAPEGSFGRAYAAFLDDNGLSPFVLTENIDAAMRARNTYGIRYATTHDMFHVLLGYGPDWIGEMGVLAFTVGQAYNRTLWAQAAAAWLTYPIWSGFRIGALLAAWKRGVALGKQAPFMLGERLEDDFDTPLDTLRARYGLDENA